MKGRKRSKVTYEEKERIIQASLESECDISKLAFKNKLAPDTIKKWRAAYKKAEESKQLSEQTDVQFVELTTGISSSKVNTLKKVELQFTRYRCQIEGSLNVSQLQQIIQILGSDSC